MGNSFVCWGEMARLMFSLSTLYKMNERYFGLESDWRRAHRVYARLEKWGA
jgi:hypothetical protein